MKKTEAHEYSCILASKSETDSAIVYIYIYKMLYVLFKYKRITRRTTLRVYNQY